MMKKIMSSVIAFALAASLAAVSASAAVKGDVDSSGKVDIEDAVAIISHINGIKCLTGTALNAADVDSNGDVDILDAVAVIDRLNGTSAKTENVYENSVFTLNYDKFWTLEDKASDYVLLTHNEFDHSVIEYFGSVSVDYERFTVENIDDLKRYAKKTVDLSFLNKKDKGTYSVISEKSTVVKGQQAYEYQLEHKFNGETVNYLDLTFVNKGSYVICVNSDYAEAHSSVMRSAAQSLINGLEFK